MNTPTNISNQTIFNILSAIYSIILVIYVILLNTDIKLMINGYNTFNGFLLSFSAIIVITILSTLLPNNKDNTPLTYTSVIYTIALSILYLGIFTIPQILLMIYQNQYKNVINDKLSNHEIQDSELNDARFKLSKIYILQFIAIIFLFGIPYIYIPHSNFLPKLLQTNSMLLYASCILMGINILIMNIFNSVHFSYVLKNLEVNIQ